jgi:hypothetical protein
MDAKVSIKVGEFDRGGKTRVATVALDHDFSDFLTFVKLNFPPGKLTKPPLRATFKVF